MVTLRRFPPIRYISTSHTDPYKTKKSYKQFLIEKGITDLRLQNNKGKKKKYLYDLIHNSYYQNYSKHKVHFTDKEINYILESSCEHDLIFEYKNSMLKSNNSSPLPLFIIIIIIWVSIVCIKHLIF